MKELICAKDLIPTDMYLLTNNYYALFDRIENVFVAMHAKLIVPLNSDIDSKDLKWTCRFPRIAFNENTPCSNQHRLLFLHAVDRIRLILMCSNDSHGWLYKAFEKIS